MTPQESAVVASAQEYVRRQREYFTFLAERKIPAEFWNLTFMSDIEEAIKDRMQVAKQAIFTSVDSLNAQDS